MGRPMPQEIRQHLRAKQHPALDVPCGHCQAREHQPCRLPSKRQTLPSPHPSRQRDAQLIATRVCPACQTTPGVPCRYDDDRPYPGVHPQRATAA